MKDENKDDLPQILNTGGGYTVFYKERYLYSKRMPSKQIETFIEGMEKTPKTLFLFASSPLGYGAMSFINVLPPSSFLLFVECDSCLANLFEENILSLLPNVKNVSYVSSNNIFKIIEHIEDFTSFNFTKTVLIRGSGGYSLYEKFYISLVRLVEDVVSIHWKNRITLIEMGRLYAKNIFKNLCFISTLLEEERKRIKILKESYVNTPILVLGAGPSLDFSYDFIKRNRNKLFLLSVDVALPSLISMGIKPDGVVLLEGQYWVQNAFLESECKDISLFTSITANPRVLRLLKGDVFLYATKYAKMQFLNNLAKTFIDMPVFDSVGSVGLVALQIAMFIAKQEVPIFHMGLDFAYEKGFTHGKNTLPIKNLFLSNNRLNSLYKGSSIFPLKNIKCKGKNGHLIFTTPILQSYALIYKKLFSKASFIFDIANIGLYLSENTICLNMAEKKINFILNDDVVIKEKQIDDNVLKDMLEKEKLRLNEIKNMLVGKILFDKERMAILLKDADYLYFHFPDYVSEKTLNLDDISFLKRIRIELESFLKILECLCVRGE